MSLSAPSKHLRYSEADFTGYWVQLNALIRHNDHADKVLDQLLVNPLNTLLTLDEDSELEEALVACYAANNFGFPPSKQLFERPSPGMCPTNRDLGQKLKLCVWVPQAVRVGPEGRQGVSKPITTTRTHSQCPKLSFRGHFCLTRSCKSRNR